MLSNNKAFERRRVRGNWNISPLWEGKILLGVLKQQGLAGKGLIKAFDKWAPRIVGVSRLDMDRAYGQQTGRTLSDYILAQQADKAVRYRQLPPEADGYRLLLAESTSGQKSESNTLALDVRAWSAEEGGTILPIRSAVIEKIALSGASRSNLLGPRLSNTLLSTNELADLTGFAPKTIRRWASRRLLNFIRVGKQFRFRAAAVDLFLAQREVRK
ncbi:MAG: helix-turn-helix domain-containing protein [Candidatus Acidiferrum sp.]